MSHAPTLQSFLAQLEDARAWFRIERVRRDSVMVLIATPGRYWEVEFMGGGALQVECFRSDGVVADHLKLAELFAELR